MYQVHKRLEISASHKLTLSYESKCENLHGHNWIIDIFIRGEELNQDGMLFDFTHIKRLIVDRLDHQNLNDVLLFNPTAENMAKWIHDQIKGCFRVDVQESENNVASYME